MNNDIHNFLEEMGLKSTECSIEPGSLEPSFYQYRGKIKRSKKYCSPTFGDIHALKEKKFITTGDIARFNMVLSKTAMKWTGPSYHEQKKYIPSSVWHALVETLGLKERATLIARQADIRVEVYETHTQPTKHELWQLYVMSLKNKDDISKETGISEQRLRDNFKRGKLPFSDFTFVNTKMWSKLETDMSDLTLDEWQKLKKSICPAKRTHPPLIREACVSKNTQFDIYAHKRETTKLTANTSNKKASFQLVKGSQVYLDTDSIYSPPNKKEFIAVLTFLGISFKEAAIVMDCSYKRIEKINEGQIKPSYYEWRRLLEVFQLSSPRSI